MEYQVTFSIKEGSRYRISPSYGYQGITSGIVEIEAVLASEQLANKGYDQYGEIVGAYMDAELSCLDGDDYTNRVAELRNSTWVIYYYPYEPSEQGEYYALPVDEFVYHISRRL